MNKTQKKKKELERYINREERKVCEKVKEEIKIYEKVNEINHLNKKRERSASKEEKEKTNENTKKQNVNVDIDSIIDKIFSIAEKRKSFDKTIKLLNFIILKLKDRDDKIDKFLNIFTKIVFAEYKNNTIANVDKYKELYDLALSTLTDADKETSQYKFLSLYQLLFDNEYLLYKDDSFVFTSAEKKISNVFSSLPDITTEEDESFQNFINDINSKKQIEFSDMLSTAIKRRLCVMMYLNMSSFCHMKMRVYIKQFYRDIMLNHIGKLNEEMKKKMKDAIKNVEHRKGNIIKAIDDRIKETPLESYYKVEDAREEKYVVANMNKWEAKQNGIEATKQYFG